MTAGVVINKLTDALAAVEQILESAQHDIAFLVPPSLFLNDTVEREKRFTENGGVMRGISTISHANIEEIRKRVNFGVDLRHADSYNEIFMIVGDRRQSLSGINIGVRDYTFDTPITAFWSDDPAYAEYLLACFENAWSHAVPAEERIKELLKRGPLKADH